MKNADIRAAQEEIEAIKERARRQEDAGKLTAKKEAHADADILANYRVIEDVLKKADATKRAELIKNNDLSSLFDADGSLNADFTKRLDGSVTSDYNRKYYNRAMHGNEDVIQGDLERINADLAQKYNGKAEKVSVYDGELSAKAEGAYNKIKKFLNVISRKSGKDIGLVVTNSSPQFNGINIDDRVYATTDNLESGKVFKTIVEETTHFAEGTQEHRALVALLSSDASLVESTVGRLLSTKGYGFDANRLRMVGEKIASGAVDASDFGAEAVKYSIKNKESALTDDEAGATLYYKGGQSYSLNERLRETPDVDSLPEDVRKKVEMLDSALKKLPTYKGVTYRNIGFDDNGGEEAFHDFMRRHTEGEIVAYTAYTSTSTAQDGYPIEGNYVVHMVIEGKNGRNLDGFGNNMESEVLFERETMFFIDKIVYAENGIPTIYMQEVNENGIGQLYSAERGTAVRNMQEHNPQELGLQGLSERKTEGDSTGSMGSQGELSGGQWDSVRAEGSELRSKRTVREKQDRANGEEELNSDDYAMYAEFASEVGAHMSAEMLGNEAFIDRIIRSDASLAEKILGKIIDVKNALSRIGDPEAQAQHKRLVEAEKLYLKAIEAAGYRYVDGKIVVPEDEEKENTAEGGEKYSYESLIKKGNMNIATLKPLNEVEASRYSSDHTAMAKHAMQIARDVKNEKNTDQRTYLYCNDIKEDIMVSPKSFKHSAARTDSEYCQVCFSLPEILENAIVVNELSPRGKNNGSLVLLGMAQTEERYVYVRMVVENRTWNLENYDIVYAIKKQSIEKEDVSQKAPGLRQKDGSQTSSVISIADFLHNVKSFEVINEVFSKDIANKLGATRYTGDLSKDLRYSFKENAAGKKTTPPATKEYKQYSQKEVKALVGDILSDELVFEKGKATFEKKADIEQEVKKLLDTVSLEKSPEKAIGKIADYLLEKAHIKGVYADVSEEITRHQKTVESFSRYIRCLDLTPVMAKLTKKDGKMSGAFYRWNNRKGNEIYLKADKALKKHQKEHGTLKAVLSDEEYSTTGEGIVERIPRCTTREAKPRKECE